MELLHLVTTLKEGYELLEGVYSVGQQLVRDDA